MPTTIAASASGARLTGDDLQHAVAWHAALRTLVPHAGVHSVTVEAADVGNVDDVVVGKTIGPDDYIQVKATASAKHAATIEWLTQPTRSGGPSILQRFHHAALDLRGSGANPELTLVTNRSIHPDDPVLTLRDRNDRLAERLRLATTRTTVAARDQLLRHLGCTDNELYEFLSHLRLRTDASEAAWRDQIFDISYAAGIRADDTAVRLGVSEVREWVKTNRSTKNTDDIAAAVDRLGIRAHDPYTVVAIKALDDDDLAVPDTAVTLDWVDRFNGTEARNRRGLKDPRDWNNALRPELLQTQRALRRLGAHRVLLTGSMRLPTWFTAGVTFQETAGFTPAKIKDGHPWTKPHHPITPARITTSDPIAKLPCGSELALAVAVSADLTADVKTYLGSIGMHIPVLTVSVPAGVSNASITGPEHAYGVALAVRDLARELNRTIKPPILHLFLATPAALALLLGGLWDRVPTTQTYEDLTTGGYQPAFIIPN